MERTQSGTPVGTPPTPTIRYDSGLGLLGLFYHMLRSGTRFDFVLVDLVGCSLRSGALP